MAESGSAHYRNLTHRTKLVFGETALIRLADIRVIVIGVGGVGSWCAEALIRSGIMHLTIVDSDIVCATNCNRQIQATAHTIGQIKVDALRERLLTINPEAQITAINRPFTPESSASFELDSYDYVIDAIDSVRNKVHLIECCLSLGKKFISSMGAGARSDPSRIRLSKLSDTRTCSLARIVRQRLKKNHVRTDFLCVWSDEVPVKPQTAAMCAAGNCVCSCDRDAANSDGTKAVDWCAQKKQINGSLVHITGMFGFTIAGAVLRDAAGIQSIPARKTKTP